MMMETGNKLSLSRIIVSGSGMILASQTELYHAIYERSDTLQNHNSLRIGLNPFRELLFTDGAMTNSRKSHQHRISKI